MASKPTDDSQAVRDKIAQLPAFRDLASRLHEVILEAAPELQPRLYYGMPGYALAKRSPILVFFRVDDDQFAVLGLSEKANLDLHEDATDLLRPSAWFLNDLDDATEARIADIVVRAVR